MSGLTEVIVADTARALPTGEMPEAQDWRVFSEIRKGRLSSRSSESRYSHPQPLSRTGVLWASRRTTRSELETPAHQVCG